MFPYFLFSSDNLLLRIQLGGTNLNLRTEWERNHRYNCFNLNFGFKAEVAGVFCASLLLRLLKLCSFVILWLFVCCFCWLFCSVLFAGLFPAVLNLATNALITTNATCGEKGREMYCKLVEHVPGQPARNPQCRICDQRSRVLHRKSAVFSFISFKYTLFTMVSNTQQTAVCHWPNYYKMSISVFLRMLVFSTSISKSVTCTLTKSFKWSTGV